MTSNRSRTEETVENQPSTTPAPKEEELAGKMIFMKDKASSMPDKKEPNDITEKASERSDEKSTQIARQMESDDIKENMGSGLVDSPDGDADAENRVSTSLSDE